MVVSISRWEYCSEVAARQTGHSAITDSEFVVLAVESRDDWVPSIN